jgi:hypothetical protein
MENNECKDDSCNFGNLDEQNIRRYLQLVTPHQLRELHSVMRKKGQWDTKFQPVIDKYDMNIYILKKLNEE